MSFDKTIRSAIAFPLLFGSFGVWLYQAYFYLRWGLWFDGSLISAIGYLGTVRNDLPTILWVRDPGSWLGLHGVLGWIPTALITFFIGLFVLKIEDV